MSSAPSSCESAKTANPSIASSANRHNDPLLNKALFKQKFVRVITGSWRSKSVARGLMAIAKQPCLLPEGNSSELLTPSFPKASSSSPRGFKASASQDGPSIDLRTSPSSPCFRNCVHCEDPAVNATNKVLFVVNSSSLFVTD